ncbi:MAG: tetratricopeptide repeat protein [Geothrix sp.]|uniref:tetratricopeptide repeat protein n=1 Tax=Geothrix sp. TaxID=1962974 RepID=UPI00184BAE55|nr:tetratricopeptide repeat protein [Geothrix sp.]NWJ42147.1 tetratricopeptide repeat protein [Geothrix sp.]WIL19890.1 MAG: tetratricopeptide repeat protein [Geothrix sp.]
MIRIAPVVLLSVLQAQAPAFRADLEAGRYLKVLAEADQRLREHPNDASAWAAKSQALSSLLRFGEALAAAERAVSLKPDLADALLARGLARAGEAIKQRDLGALRSALGAMDDLRAATAADPTLVPAWTSLGLAYEMLPGLLGGSTRKALQCAERLRALAPARGDLLQALVLVEEGKWGEAEPWFGRALAKAPQDPEVVGQWLDALDRKPAKKALGEAGKNARLLLEAPRLLPGVHTRARGVVAVSDAYLHAGQPEAAWKVIQDHLGQVDAPSLLRLQLGKVAAASGLHRTEGLATLDQVLREPLEGGSSGYPGAWWRRGQILQGLGRKDEARRSAQEALKLDPRHRGARELLEQMQTSG